MQEALPADGACEGKADLEPPVQLAVGPAEVLPQLPALSGPDQGSLTDALMACQAALQHAPPAFDLQTLSR